jgi:hypothetical protein
MYHLVWGGEFAALSVDTNLQSSRQNTCELDILSKFEL